MFLQLCPKWYLDHFSPFCTVHSRAFQYLTMSRVVWTRPLSLSLIWATMISGALWSCCDRWTSSDDWQLDVDVIVSHLWRHRISSQPFLQRFYARSTRFRTVAPSIFGADCCADFFL